MNSTYTLTITEADLDAAIARREDSTYHTCLHCLVAQTLARQGTPSEVGYGFRVNGAHFSLFRTPVMSLIRAFDDKDYDAVRAALPMTVELTAGF